MNFNLVEFYTSYGKISQLENTQNKEIVFVGRSNVGKSTLINKIFNRKSLARVSSTPGKTATINFFKLDDIFFVDLPGYGYAKVSKTEKAKWSTLINGYFTSNRNISLVIQLVDIRHKPSEDDINMYNYLKENNFNFIIVLTKLDKIKKSQINQRIEEIRKFLYLDSLEHYFCVSSIKNLGFDELRNFITNFVER